MRWPSVRIAISTFLQESRIGRLRLKRRANLARSRHVPWPIKRFRFLLFLVLGVGFCSCATPALAPIAPGEMRLLHLKPPSGEILANIQYVYAIEFEADGRPGISRVCFYWSGDGPYCVRPKKVEYGQPGTIEVELRSRPPGVSSYGTYNLEAYAEYVREGKSTRTNSVSTHITVFLK